MGIPVIKTITMKDKKFKPEIVNGDLLIPQILPNKELYYLRIPGDLIELVMEVR